MREANVYSEIVPHTITAAELATRAPAAIILSGGPKSVHVEGAPVIDPGVYDLGVPILGICYGSQLIAQQLGGTVARGGSGEYGRTVMHLDSDASAGCGLLAGLPANQTVWMSHFDAISVPPEGFTATASSEGAPVAVLENPDRRIWGVQFHPEVHHTPHGQDVIERFLIELAGCSAGWTMADFVEVAVADIRAQVGDGRAICGLSGESTRRSPRHWSTRRSVRSSPACSSTPV
ncbi:MAG: glutamine-hydrolyzing GMP synthase [Microthrixaceae bacterium]|nr:glutamine-hydrolyzing GMP synthase [Microthrixaceae bacterium]